MTTVRELHTQAMALAQQALVQRESGNVAQASALAASALTFEVDAAQLITKSISSEPTRSIIYQSAASLALQAGKYAEAQRLVAEALTGFPPPRVEQELKELFEQINFAAHLSVHTDPLSVSQMQLAITGNDVGFGRVIYSAFDDRLRALMGLLERTSRRLAGDVYQRSMTRKSSNRLFTTIISAPRAGSFAVTVELAPRSDQPQSLLVSGGAVIDQVIDGVRAVQNQALDELRSRISDERYYVNFVTLAQQLAPDGDKVKMVGLTSAKGNVSFTKPKTTIELPVVREAVESVADQLEFTTTVRGVLDEATVRGSEKVGLTTTDSKVLELRVREGMDDIVRNHFNRQVEVRVRGRRGSTELVSVVAVED